MKKKYFVLIMIASVCIILCTFSCKKDKEETPETVMTDQSFYKDIAIGLVNCYVDIYNQNLAGTPTGSVNTTVNGPMGGTVTITGSFGYDNTHGITTVDLLFSMTEIKCINSYVNLTLTGGTTYTGSFSNDHTSVNHQSENILIVGTVTRNSTTRNINMAGNVSINRGASSSATIFGHTVSW